jgi:hypothetical protein
MIDATALALYVPGALGVRTEVWYPTLSPAVRTVLIGFARRMMAARRLEPGAIWTRWDALR